MEIVFNKKLEEFECNMTTKRSMRQIEEIKSMLKANITKSYKETTNFEYELSQRFSIKKFGSDEVLVRKGKGRVKNEKRENYIAAIEDFYTIINKYHKETGRKFSRLTQR